MSIGINSVEHRHKMIEWLNDFIKSENYRKIRYFNVYSIVVSFNSKVLTVEFKFPITLLSDYIRCNSFETLASLGSGSFHFVLLYL